jgi:hypothetical protein
MTHRARSKWALAKGRATRYSGAFVGKLGEMLEAPAFMGRRSGCCSASKLSFCITAATTTAG